LVHDLGFKNACFKFGRVKKAGESRSAPAAPAPHPQVSRLYVSLLLQMKTLLHSGCKITRKCV